MKKGPTSGTGKKEKKRASKTMLTTLLVDNHNVGS